MSKKYYVLMNKNNIVLPFTSEKNEFQETIFEQSEEERAVLPYSFTSIQSFIERRRAPKSRKHIAKLLQETGCNDFEKFIDVTMGLSLNDTFWIKQEDADVKWEDVSLYRNSFNDVIARVAFDGGDLELSSSSPEYTTDGTYAKCWKRDGENIYLLKTNSETGTEVFSEFYASQIAEIMCKSSVKYDLDVFHGKTVCKCGIFTDERYGYLPAVKVLEESNYKKVSYLLQYFSDIGCEEGLRRMLVLDALILNIDRHAGNYGFLVENDTQEIKTIAPMFDHNRSLLFDVRDYGDDYIKTIVPRIGADFNIAANSVLNDEIKSDLLNLKGFRFQRSSMGDDLSDERICLLEEIVNRQIDYILNRKQLYFCSFE